ADEVQNGPFVLCRAKMGNASGLAENGPGRPSLKLVRVELVAVAVIEGAGDHEGVSLIGMGMRLRGRIRRPLHKHAVQSGLALISEQNSRLSAHVIQFVPLSLVRRDGKPALWHIYPRLGSRANLILCGTEYTYVRHCDYQNCDRADSSHRSPFASSWLQMNTFTFMRI